jgi:membrane associated rhomboid family serine protease
MSFQRTLKKCFFLVSSVVAALWCIHFFVYLFQLDLTFLGVYPRSFSGLKGILFGPLIHGSWQHLFFNSAPLVVLGTALLYRYQQSAMIAVTLLYLGSGVGVWLFARSSYHLGASGVTHGLMYFIFISGIMRRDRPSIALTLMVLFLYGGMLWTIFPHAPNISFESHLAGAVCGVLLAILLRHRDPPIAAKKYDWEDETSNQEEIEISGHSPLDPLDPNDKYLP